MKIQEIKILLDKYYNGETTLEEEAALRDYFRRDDIPAQFQRYIPQFRYMDKVTTSEITADDLLNLLPDDESNLFPKHHVNVIGWVVRIAASLLLIFSGFAAGIWYQHSRVSRGINEITSKSRNDIPVENASWYNRIQKASASEQIQLIGQVGHSSKGNDLVIQTLINAMNTAGNVNVRMAAAEALFKFRNQPVVKRAFVKSLAHQNDPNMQITLISLIVHMRDRSAIEAMQLMLLDKNIDKVVRYKLEEGIGILS